MNILIVRLSSIGDVIHTLPAASQLKQAYAGSTLVWVCGPAVAGLLQRYRDVDRVIVFDKHWLRTLAVRKLAGFLRTLRAERYDLVLDFQGLLKSALIAACARGRRTVGFAGSREGSGFLYSELAPPQDFNHHALERHLGLVHHLGLQHQRPRFAPLYAVDDEQHVSETLERTGVPEGRPLVCVHPRARWQTKCWPWKYAAGLCRTLAGGEGCCVLLIGSAGDRAYNEGICREAGSDVFNLAGMLGLPGLAALLRRAALAVTVDSGPMHMACAVGTPLIALMGPTAPWRTGPFGDRAETVFLGLPCSPCYARSRCPLGHHRCLRDISVADVYKLCCNVLHKKGVTRS